MMSGSAIFQPSFWDKMQVFFIEKTLHSTWKNLTSNLKKPYIQLEKTLHDAAKRLIINLKNGSE